MFSWGASIGSGVITAPVLVTALASTAILAGSVNGSIAAVTATITNPANKFGLQPPVVLVQSVTDGSATCRSDASPSNNYTCPDIDVLDGRTNVVTLHSTHVAKTLSFRQVNSKPLTSFALDLGPCNLTAGSGLCGTNASQALLYTIEYSLDNGDNWFVVETLLPAKTLGDQDNVLHANQEQDIRNHLANSANQVLFRFSTHIGSGAAPGSQMTQDATWSITG